MGFTNIGTGEGHFFDVDGDLDLDVINCGVDDDNTAYAELWLNNINS